MGTIKKEVMVSMNDALALGMTTQVELANYLGLKQPTISYKRKCGKTYLKFNLEVLEVLESKSCVEFRE